MTLLLNRIELQGVLEELPNPQDIESIRDRTFDYGIFPQGFEERVLGAPKRLKKLGCRVGTCIIPAYPVNKSANTGRWESLKSCLEQLSDQEFEFINTDDASAMLEWLLKERVQASVLFDLSGASNPLILKVLTTLMRLDVDLTIVYSEAALYRPDQESYIRAKSNKKVSRLELASGTGPIESAVELPGELDDSARDCVMLIPGFDRDRAQSVISFVDPTLLISGREQIIWLVGKPHLPENIWRSELMKEIHGIGAQWPTFHLMPTFDYKVTWHMLDSIYMGRCLRDRFTLSPMGSKFQAVGCALFCESRPDVRVVYATPFEYRTDAFTSGVSDIWVLQFGSTAQLRKLVNSVGQLRVLTEQGDIVLTGIERKWN